MTAKAVIPDFYLSFNPTPSESHIGRDMKLSSQYKEQNSKDCNLTA